MQDVPLAKPRSPRRSAQLALASRWARTLGRVLFGVAAPLVCFGVLLHSLRETWMWPLALFVVTCVAAYVACWLRAPREDALNAALWGARAACRLRWRWVAPERRWGRIVDAWTTSTPQERARLDDAHEALTRRRIVVDSDD